MSRVRPPSPAFCETAHGHLTASRFSFPPTSFSSNSPAEKPERSGNRICPYHQRRKTMIQGKAVAGAVGQSGRSAVSSSPIHFTPERALAAIEYHLIDEGIARFVTVDSVQRTLKRLHHESFVLSISARTWATMTNSGRLRRLLEETATEAELLPDDTVILAHRARSGR